MKFHSGFNKPSVVISIFLVSYQLMFFVLSDLNLSYLKWPAVSCILRWYLDLIKIIVSCILFYGKLHHPLAMSDEGTNRLMRYTLWEYFNEKKFKSPVPSLSDSISFTFLVYGCQITMKTKKIYRVWPIISKRIKKIRLSFVVHCTILM